MVFLDWGLDAGGSVGLPDQGLEETFYRHLGTRPRAFHLLDVRWRRVLIALYSGPNLLESSKRRKYKNLFLIQTSS